MSCLLCDLVQLTILLSNTRGKGWEKFKTDSCWIHDGAKITFKNQVAWNMWSGLMMFSITVARSFSSWEQTVFHPQISLIKTKPFTDWSARQIVIFSRSRHFLRSQGGRRAYSVCHQSLHRIWKPSWCTSDSDFWNNWVDLVATVKVKFIIMFMIVMNHNGLSRSSNVWYVIFSTTRINHT